MTGEYQLKFISIHAPRAGSDAADGLRFCKNSDFNPRSPCGERLTGDDIAAAAQRISIHAPRAGSDAKAVVKNEHDFMISIHAPRAGSDRQRQRKYEPRAVISIHAPRAGSDKCTYNMG